MMSSMMRGGGKPPGPAILRAYRVTADGAETLVRGLQFDSVPHARVPRHPRGLERAQSLQLPLVAAAGDAADVDAAGRRRRRANRCVSVIAPNLLFAELEIEKPDRPFQRPPIVPSPLP